MTQIGQNMSLWKAPRWPLLCWWKKTLRWQSWKAVTSYFPTIWLRTPKWRQSGWVVRARFDIQWPRVQVPLWPLRALELCGRLWFNSSAMLVNSQLVCLPPVGILNHVTCMFIIWFYWPWKVPLGEWWIKIFIIYYLFLLLIGEALQWFFIFTVKSFEPSPGYPK